LSDQEQILVFQNGLGDGGRTATSGAPRRTAPARRESEEYTVGAAKVGQAKSPAFLRDAAVPRREKVVVLDDDVGLAAPQVELLSKGKTRPFAPVFCDEHQAAANAGNSLNERDDLGGFRGQGLAFARTVTRGRLRQRRSHAGKGGG
jgi:hypothetical protein